MDVFKLHSGIFSLQKYVCREYNIHQMLPESCFQTGGVVIQPQLLDLVKSLGYELAEDQANKLWER